MVQHILELVEDTRRSWSKTAVQILLLQPLMHRIFVKKFLRLSRSRHALTSGVVQPCLPLVSGGVGIFLLNMLNDYWKGF